MERSRWCRCHAKRGIGRARAQKKSRPPAGGRDSVLLVVPMRFRCTARRLSASVEVLIPIRKADLRRRSLVKATNAAQRVLRSKGRNFRSSHADTARRPAGPRKGKADTHIHVPIGAPGLGRPFVPSAHRPHESSTGGTASYSDPCLRRPGSFPLYLLRPPRNGSSSRAGMCRRAPGHLDFRDGDVSVMKERNNGGVDVAPESLRHRTMQENPPPHHRAIASVCGAKPL